MGFLLLGIPQMTKHLETYSPLFIFYICMLQYYFKYYSNVCSFGLNNVGLAFKDIDPWIIYTEGFPNQ